jgi:hypothetical protein
MIPNRPFRPQPENARGKLLEAGVAGAATASLALYIQAVFLAKANGTAAIAHESVAHLKRCFGMLFKKELEPPCHA